ncbi:MAG: DUF3267 domain-containing protein [Chloroflexi bacterium]|nr:DUF3267 domain-containing protein [Chloroflexota bacterium]
MSFPDPPPGYAPAVRFEYPKRPLQITGTIFALILMPSLLFLTTWLNDSGLSGVFDKGLLGVVIMVSTIAITILAHELTHGLVYQLLGYQVTYGADLKLMAAYAAAFGQFQKRSHNLLVALAPLIVLTPLFVALLNAANTTITLIAYTGLLFNTSGAVGDLYLTWRLLRWPSGSLLYDVDPATMLVYLPEGLNSLT